VIEITMPKLGPAMEEGIIAKWHKAEGDAVRIGEPLVDIETEKTVFEVDAQSAGILRKVLVHDGETASVGAVIGMVGTADEILPERALEMRVAERAPLGSMAAPPPAGHSAGGASEALRASPSAKRRARELGIELSRVAGTGPEGRITAGDVDRAVGEARSAARSGARGMVVTPSAMRRAIGERMAASKQTVPHFYATVEVDMTRVAEKRAAWKARDGDAAPSVNDVLIWACASALKAQRAVNSGWIDDRIVIFNEVNVGIAMATDNGLVVPVVRDADGLSPHEIAARTGQLRDKVRDKKLTAFDTEDATFTISNLGMFGVEWFVPIINPPQCAILGAGRVAERVVPYNGEAAIRPEMTLTLSADHRIVDGVAAGRFLQAVRSVLEEISE